MGHVMAVSSYLDDMDGPRGHVEHVGHPGDESGLQHVRYVARCEIACLVRGCWCGRVWTVWDAKHGAPGKSIC